MSVGNNKVMKVGDHDFSKVSIIPYALLIHDIPGCNDEEEESGWSWSWNRVGEWYRGQVYHGIKDMRFQGSTAWRGVVELSETLNEHHRLIPPHLYLYTDGGSDRRITYHRVQIVCDPLFKT